MNGNPITRLGKVKYKHTRQARYIKDKKRKFDEQIHKILNDCYKPHKEDKVSVRKWLCVLIIGIVLLIIIL